MPRSKIAIAGGTGYIGKIVTNAFIKAAMDEGWVEELIVLTRNRSELTDEFESQGVTVSLVDFSLNDTLVSALIAVDVVVCTIGTGPGTDLSKAALLSALLEARVMVYFPSEFGTNHYTRVSKQYLHHPIFEAKKAHFHEAKEKGLKVVGLFCSSIMEKTFGPEFGMDKNSDVWKLVGKGNVPVSVTAETDLGQYTVGAVFISVKLGDPKKVPSMIEVYSQMKTVKEYAKLFKKYNGKPTTLEFIPLKEAVQQYRSNHDFLCLIPILFEEGANNFTGSKGNKLLNPYEYVWKCKTIEEYIKETS